MLAFQLCCDCQLCFILHISYNNIGNHRDRGSTDRQMLQLFSERSSVNQLPVLRLISIFQLLIGLLLPVMVVPTVAGCTLHTSDAGCAFLSKSLKNKNKLI